MPEQIKWHRLAGLVLQPLFDQLGCETEIEVDLSLKEQRVDIIVVQKEEGQVDFSQLPRVYWEVFADLNTHNLISIKSYSESFTAESLEEFYGHLTNYRKVKQVSWEQVNLYAIVYHYPRDLFRAFEGTEFLKVVKEKEIFDLALSPLKRVRFVITQETDNPVLSLFSGDAHKVSQSYVELKQQTTLLEGISVYFQKINEYYGEEFLNMYTKEDFLRDYPPKKEYPFVFPWSKEYHEKAIQEATQQGIQQGKLETAKNMLAKGVKIPLISEITGLSEHDILTLKAE